MFYRDWEPEWSTVKGSQWYEPLSLHKNIVPNVLHEPLSELSQEHNGVSWESC